MISTLFDIENSSKRCSLHRVKVSDRYERTCGALKETALNTCLRFLDGVWNLELRRSLDISVSVIVVIAIQLDVLVVILFG